MEGTRVIGPYELVRRIGGRGIAEVFVAQRANRKSAGSGLALKLLKSGFSDKAELRKTFQTKVLIASLCEHPNLPATLEVGESDEGVPFIAMELVDGVKLSEFLSRRVFFHPAIAATIIRAIAEALHHLHTLRDNEERALEVVHLEVCAENVLLARDGRVKLLDCGTVGAAISWDSGHIVSNVAHLSPEQSGKGVRIDRGSDLFSLGVLLFKMVEDPRMVELPLREIIARATANNPQERFASAREMADSLGVYLLTQHVFNAEVAIRSAISSLEQASLIQTLPEPLFVRSTSDVSFGADTRIRTLDLTRPSRRRDWLPVVASISVLIAVAAAVIAFFRFR